MEEIFDIEKFNIISDEENYYFFRSLEPGDIEDLEKGIIKEGEKYKRLRTDRERWEESHQEKPRWDANSSVTLEEMFNHIKIHYNLQTNCISLSSNANVARTYGEAFSDKYVMIRVPKKEMGEKVFHAGQYMLDEIAKQTKQRIEEGKIPKDVLEDLEKIDKAKTSDEIKELIKIRYRTPKKLDESKARPRKGITYRAPHARVSSWQSLNEEQKLEKNKIIAKLTVLEHKKLMKPLMPNSANNNLLIRTVGSAFASGEQIYYGDIEGDRVTDIQKEIVDIFGLLQQVEGQKETIEELKKEIIQFVRNGNQIDIEENSILINEIQAKDDISIEEMYKITDGKVEYGQASSIVKNLFYLAKGQAIARELANKLRKITKNNPKYEDIIKYIEKNGFEIETKISTRQSNKGYKLSESVNLNLKQNEIGLVEQIRKLSDEEQAEIIQNRGLSNIKELITKNFSEIQKEEQIDKSRYYAEAIFSMYDWKAIGIKEFSDIERENIIKRIRDEHCIEVYQMLEKEGISIKDIPRILLNIITRKNDFEVEEETLEQYENIKKEKRINQYKRIVKEDKEELNEELSIERIERFLGYYDIPNTGITLKPYQQTATNNVDEKLENNRFASVILPTGGGKSFIALDQLLKHKDEKMLYLAPQNEILEQIKDYIIKYIHGPVGTINKSKDEIVAEVFPNLQFATYSSLLSKDEEELKEQYDFIVLDELHRTGASKWGKKLKTLLANQPKTTKALGITATPRRDVDGRNMANEIAEIFGYTNKEAVQGKHIAMNMSLTNAIRLGLVVNPKLISCAYTLKTDGSLDRLKEKIDQIEDVKARNEELEKYEALRRNLDGVDGISKILQSNVKKGGKYIVFLPMIEDLEDEDGNLIGRKRGKDRIAEYEKQIAEYFKDSDIKPNFHSMLGEYGDKSNAKRLEEFQNRDTDDTEFMLVINKANEGLHLEKLDGMIWLRPMDENSKILYLQQLGRVIYSEDKDNPTKDEDRPVVIDLVNNTLKVNWEDEITEQDDIELMNIITNWTKIHDGMLPDINSSDNEEAGYAKVLKKIQNKYKRYLDDDFEDISDNKKDEIQEILRLGSEIDLWQIELPERVKKENETKNKSKSNNYQNIFELTGIERDFVELENEVDDNITRSISLKNAIQIEKWCIEKYGRKAIEYRCLPSRKSDNKEERELWIKLMYLRQKIKVYKEQDISSIQKEERQVIEIIERLDREYGLGKSLKNAIQIEKWCERTYGEKDIEDRYLPNMRSKNKEEKELGKKLDTLKTKIKEYKGQDITNIQDEEDRKIIEILERLDREYGLGQALKNAIKIEKWCKRTYGEKDIEDRYLPSLYSDNKEERELGIKLNNLRQKIKAYKEQDIPSIQKEDIQIIEILERLDREYGLGQSLKNAIKIEKWCRRTYGEKDIEDRYLPSSHSDNKEEKDLGIKLKYLRKKIKKYKGQDITNIQDEEDRQIIEIIERLDREYRKRDGSKKRKSKEIAEATISSIKDVELADKEEQVLKALVEKGKKQKQK